MIHKKLLSSLAVAVALSSLGALSLGCTQTVVVREARGRGVDVPFRGVYSKVAEATFKNGRRVRVANANGAATVRIDAGKVTYDQTYVARGEVRRVSQLYTFRARDVHPMGNGEYEVDLTFQGMGGDTQGYSPDRNNPKLEIHPTPSGWAVDLFTTDNNGIIGVLECQ
jgi:hypothetical protein